MKYTIPIAAALLTALLGLTFFADIQAINVHSNLRYLTLWAIAHGPTLHLILMTLLLTLCAYQYGKYRAYRSFQKSMELVQKSEIPNIVANIAKEN